jgi:endonuclease-3
MNPNECAREVHRRLLEKYGDPSWINSLPILDELISTILSQNTNDSNRDRAFTKLKRIFNSWEDVRDANEISVIEAIRSAGLANKKGPLIQKILREITEERNSLDLEFLREKSIDDAMEWLMKFNGVGPKTASIVVLFSLGKPAFPVDTHIQRVSGRIGLRPEKMSIDQTHRHLGELFPPETYKAAHLNIIRLGREVCHPRKPECKKCTLQSLCDYNQSHYLDCERSHQQIMTVDNKNMQPNEVSFE